MVDTTRRLVTSMSTPVYTRCNPRLSQHRAKVLSIPFPFPSMVPSIGVVLVLVLVVLSVLVPATRACQVQVDMEDTWGDGNQGQGRIGEHDINGFNWGNSVSLPAVTVVDGPFEFWWRTDFVHETSFVLRVGGIIACTGTMLEVVDIKYCDFTQACISVNTTQCGDGVVQSGGQEACDDGDLVTGDGCSPACQVEPAFKCTGNSPSICTPRCGDGVLDTGDACDDGNTDDGDGCGGTCLIEAGYTCQGQPSVCTPLCGNGILDQDNNEACDDGNTVAGDGCASCQVERGYTCSQPAGAGANSSASVCRVTCGNGVWDQGETCEEVTSEGAARAGDGCSGNCRLEPGYTLTCSNTSISSCQVQGPTPSNAIGDVISLHHCGISRHVCVVQRTYRGTEGRCWGHGDEGKLGHDSQDSIGTQMGQLEVSKPIQFAQEKAHPLQMISAGGLHTCGLFEPGLIRCWGYGGDGALGTNTNENHGLNEGEMEKLNFIAFSDTHLALSVSAGLLHTCAVFNNYQVRCWGLNDNGQLGGENIHNWGNVAGDMANLRYVPLNNQVTAIDAGAFHTCAVFIEGTVRCWGKGTTGQTGRGSPQSTGASWGDIQDLSPIAFADVGRVDAVQVSAGSEHTCVVFENGKARCFGAGTSGKLGYDHTNTIGDTPGQMQVLPYITFNDTIAVVQIAAGQDHTCALFSHGRVRCWGFGGQGQLGDASYPAALGAQPGDMSRLSYVNISTAPTARVSTVRVGWRHTCVLLSDGEVLCWGINTDGVLGLGYSGSSLVIPNAQLDIYHIPTLPLPYCGKGSQETNSQVYSCDDGNGVDHDGCSQCHLESGYVCEWLASQSMITCASCNDSVVSGTEGCDDGNLFSGDGCNNLCEIEVGWTCNNNIPNSASNCSQCGDGQLGGLETCDDGNFREGDGCSPFCRIEPGFTCAVDPRVGHSVCQRCGNKRREGTELCDDGNVINGDGCSDTCRIEPGYTCVASGIGLDLCGACGNGKLEGLEECDDGNVAADDGCSPLCKVESGFTCLGSPRSVCQRCGNGRVEGREVCDDGNTTPGDGCSPSCAVEVGFTCQTQVQPSVCHRCGNGVIESAGGEQCDDFNLGDGDGCSAQCQIEPGYSCSSTQPSVCQRCGDGRTSGSETCDDGNAVSDDGCSAQCQVETATGWFCTGTPSVCQRAKDTRFISRIEPWCGTIHGGTVITLHGQGMSGNYRCVFGNGLTSDVTPLTLQTGSVALVCPTPPYPVPRSSSSSSSSSSSTMLMQASTTPTTFPAYPVTLQVLDTASNTLVPIDHPTFHYYTPPRVTALTPPWVYTSGGNPITLHGHGFRNDTWVYLGVRVDKATLPASYQSPQAVVFAAPFHGATEGSNVSITLNYQGGVWRDTIVPTRANVTLKYLRCSAGMWSADDTQPCQLCSAGYYQPAVGQSECFRCSNSEYNPLPGQASCLQCPANTETVVEVATNITHCLCRADYYHPLGLVGKECLPCKVGSLCPGGSARPSPAPGYYTASLVSEEFLECPLPDSCPTGVVGGENCGDGYEGFLCGKCSSGYYKRGGQCRKCSPYASAILFVFMIIALMVSAVVLRVVRQQEEQHMAAIALLVTFFQMLGVILSVDLGWPVILRDSALWMAMPFMFDLGFLASECSVAVASFQTKWILTLCLPIVFLINFAMIYAVILVCIGWAKKRQARRGVQAAAAPELAVGDSVWTKKLDALAAVIAPLQPAELRRSITNAFALVITLIYTVIAQATLSLFDCSRLNDGTFSLNAEPSRLCFDGAWWALLPAGVLAIALYLLGIPLLIYWWIRKNRYRLKDEHFIQRFGTLFLRYKLDHPETEAFFQLRTIVILACARLMSFNPVLQGTLILFVVVVSLHVHARTHPMTIPEYNTLQTLLHFCLIVVLVGGLNFHAKKNDPSLNSASDVVFTGAMWLALIAGGGALLWAIARLLHNYWMVRRQAVSAKKTDKMVRTMIRSVISSPYLALVQSWYQQQQTVQSIHAVRFQNVLTSLTDLHNHPRSGLDWTHPAIPALNAFTRQAIKPQLLPLLAQWLQSVAPERARSDFYRTFGMLSLYIHAHRIDRSHKHHMEEDANVIKETPSASLDILADICAYSGVHIASNLLSILVSERRADSFFDWVRDAENALPATSGHVPQDMHMPRFVAPGSDLQRAAGAGTTATSLARQASMKRLTPGGGGGLDSGGSGGGGLGLREEGVRATSRVRWHDGHPGAAGGERAEEHFPPGHDPVGPLQQVTGVSVHDVIADECEVHRDSQASRAQVVRPYTPSELNNDDSEAAIDGDDVQVHVDRPGGRGDADSPVDHDHGGMDPSTLASMLMTLQTSDMPTLLGDIPMSDEE